ncbi:hypothetical protein ACFQZC_31265 [Streptacidiphilus monticola]
MPVAAFHGAPGQQGAGQVERQSQLPEGLGGPRQQGGDPVSRAALGGEQQCPRPVERGAGAAPPLRGPVGAGGLRLPERGGGRAEVAELELGLGQVGEAAHLVGVGQLHGGAQLACLLQRFHRLGRSGGGSREQFGVAEDAEGPDPEQQVAVGGRARGRLGGQGRGPAGITADGLGQRFRVGGERRGGAGVHEQAGAAGGGLPGAHGVPGPRVHPGEGDQRGHPVLDPPRRPPG